MPRKSTALAIGFLLVYLSWLAFRWIPGATSTVGDLFFLPVGATAVLASWMAGRRCSQVPRLRWFWRLMALAISCQLAGDLTVAVSGILGDPVPFPSVADLAYLALYPLMLLALLRVPVAPTFHSQRVRLGLDLATVIGAGAMVIWYLVLRQTVSEGGLDALQMATSVAYPIGDLILLGGIGVVLLRWSPPILRLPLTLITAGLAMFVVADLAYGYAVLHDGYVSGGLIDAPWMVALALFAIAGSSQATARRDATETIVPERDLSDQRVGWLPFAALATGSIVVLGSVWGQNFVAEVSLIVAAIVLATLIALRQFVTQREMIFLQRELRKAHSELAMLASHDPLTHVANRRSIEETLTTEIERAHRYERELSVLFLDVDHFKAINDRHGHVVGDRALEEFASVLRGCLRPEDTLGRWGGEEFLAVLPETGPAEAARVAERVRSQVGAHDFLLPRGEAVTCSIGSAGFPADASHASSLVDSADRAMYVAKGSGRNRVVATTDRAPLRSSSPGECDPGSY